MTKTLKLSPAQDLLGVLDCRPAFHTVAARLYEDKLSGYKRLTEVELFDLAMVLATPAELVAVSNKRLIVDALAEFRSPQIPAPPPYTYASYAIAVGFSEPAQCVGAQHTEP